MKRYPIKCVKDCGRGITSSRVRTGHTMCARCEVKNATKKKNEITAKINKKLKGECVLIGSKSWNDSQEKLIKMVPSLNPNYRKAPFDSSRGIDFDRVEIINPPKKDADNTFRRYKNKDKITEEVKRH